MDCHKVSVSASIYKDNPVSYPPSKNKAHQQLVSENYKFKIHPQLVKEAAGNKKILLSLIFQEFSIFIHNISWKVC